MPHLARAARATRSNRSRQRGEISLVGLTLTATISMMMAGAALWAQRQDMLSNLRKSQGQMLFDIGNGYNSYIVNHFSALVSGTAISGVSNPMAPSIADIQTTGDLPASYQPTSLTGLPYIASLQKVPPGCTGGACNITGLACVNGAITDPSTGQPQPLGEAIAGVGADGLASDTMSPSTLWGRNGALSVANPLGSVAGTLCMQVGYNTSGWSQFVRKDGSIGMEGDFNLAGTNSVKHNINNVNSLNAQSAAVNNGGAGQLTLGSKAAVYGDSNQAVLVSNGTVYTRDPTWTRAQDMQVQNLSTWNGSVNSDHDVTAQGSMVANSNVVSNVGNVSAANGSLTAEYDVNVNRDANANGNIWAGGNVTANNTLVSNAGALYLASGGSRIDSPGQLTVNAAGGTLYLNPWSGMQTIVGGGGGTGQLVVTGRAFANEYVQVGGYAAIGGACAPNGLIGNSGSGPAFCTNGQWTAPSSFSPRAYGTAAPDSGTIGPYNWCFVNNVVVGEDSAYGVWGVQLVADYGANNRFFRAYNSKQGGQVSYVCF
jgi:hypothetical protein